jgi:hypothetical protein
MVCGPRVSKGKQGVMGKHNQGWIMSLAAATMVVQAMSHRPASAVVSDADWSETLAVVDAEDQAIGGGSADALVAAACLRAQNRITAIGSPDPTATLLQAAASRSGSRGQRDKVERATAAFREGKLATAAVCGRGVDVLRGVDGTAEFRLTLAPGKPHLEALAVRAGEPLRLLVVGDVDSRVGLLLRDEGARPICEHLAEGRMARCQGFPQGFGQRRWSLQISTESRLPVRARLYVK